jgi:effector-binding domain-containing protein
LIRIKQKPYANQGSKTRQFFILQDRNKNLRAGEFSARRKRHYYGFAGDETKPFTLEIALPVATLPEQYDGQFHLKRTEPFRCVSVVHEGDWFEIPNAYGKIMAFVSSNGLVPIGVNRELYINADFSHPEANVTEIQMGIAAAS